MSRSIRNPLVKDAKLLHEGTSKIVRLLQAGTRLFAVNDDGTNVEGVVEAYRFLEFTRPNGQTTHEVEYRIKWSDGLYEWLDWGSVNLYSPQRPQKPSAFQPAPSRESMNA